MKWFFVLVLSILFIPGLVFSEESEETSQLDKALIFNIDNIISNIHSYQGGLGYQFGNDKWSIRIMYDLSYTNIEMNNHHLSNRLGMTYNRYLNTAFISPYIGMGTALSHNYRRSNSPSTSDYGEFNEFEVSAGPIMGTELKIHENISLFIEYQLMLSLNWGKRKYSYNGYINKDQIPISVYIDSGMGNWGMIGLCIYF